MQRIFNWDDWNTLKDGGEAEFAGNGRRVVVLEVNAEDKVRLYVQEAGTEHFLALVEGRDEIHFAVEDGFALVCRDGTAHFKTAEDADWTVEPVEDTTFTTLMERRIRNPDMELMMYLAAQNTEKRIAEQRDEFERRLKAFEDRGNVGPAPLVPAPEGVNQDDGAGSGEQAGGPDGEGDEPIPSPKPPKPAPKAS